MARTDYPPRKQGITFCPMDTLTVSSSGLYTFLSLLGFILLLGLLVVDTLLEFYLDHMESPIENQIRTVMLFHVLSVYWSLMGAAYSLKEDHPNTAFFAMVSFILNLTTSIGRLWFEGYMLGFKLKYLYL
ncbi:hypothetical protein UPYG_G00117600 [Umbra pygmaea]|uniref:Uncharacterized protein n=1 Tax=Umbra pygmaea TaxID=75934 RepID=A0ABD0X7X3_UMBPY